jgi:hypothetical protein
MVQRGGAKNYFPIPAAITDGASLAGGVDFFSITGHGSLTPNAFKVPDNTFILFMGEAGRPIPRRAFQFPELSRYRFLGRGQTAEQWHDMQYAAIRGRTFFQDLLYNSAEPFAIEKTAIYEPGDIVQDMVLQFKNDKFPFGLLGIWSCPIGNPLREQFDKINNDMAILQDNIIISERGYARAQLVAALLGDQASAAAAVAYETELSQFRSRFDALKVQGIALEQSLRGQAGNITNDFVAANTDQTLLSAVAKQISERGGKEIKFIVVEACRSIPGVDLSILPHIMRHENVNSEYNPAVLAKFRAYEGAAHSRRRASLLARNLSPAAAAAAAVAAGAGGAASGGAAAAAAAAETTFITPPFTFNMRSLHKIPEAGPIIAPLEAGVPVKLDDIERFLGEHLATSKALVDAQMATMVNGLPRQKRFQSEELVKVQKTAAGGDAYNGIVIGPVRREGYTLFKVAHFNSATVSHEEEDVDPLHMTRVDNEVEKEEQIGILASVGYDVGAQIAAMKEKYTTGVKEASQAAKKASHPKLAVLWAGEWGTNIGRGGILQAAWNATEPKHIFKRENKVKVLSGPKAESIGTVKDIGVIPEGKHKGKLFYKLRFNNETEKPQVANSMTRIGGKRRLTRRRRTHKKH